MFLQKVPPLQCMATFGRDPPFLPSILQSNGEVKREYRLPFFSLSRFDHKSPLSGNRIDSLRLFVFRFVAVETVSRFALPAGKSESESEGKGNPVGEFFFLRVAPPALINIDKSSGGWRPAG